MTKNKVISNSFAKPLGAYSHGYVIDIGDSKLIFTTGQISLDNLGNVVYPDDVEKQTEYIFESLQKILNEAGASLDDVVKATIYVTNMADFSKISSVRNRYFAYSMPVSTLVQVTSLVKPECKIEVEVVAIKGK
jgi:2-iminobutanoate/2-iminopropanoate deaminase